MRPSPGCSPAALGGPGSASALDRSRHGINIFESGDIARIALPVAVTEAGGSFRPAYQGLARFEVDTAQGTLTERPTVVSVRFDGSAGDQALLARFDVGAERSVQGPRGAYYLSGGDLLYAAP